MPQYMWKRNINKHSFGGKTWFMCLTANSYWTVNSEHGGFSIFNVRFAHRAASKYVLQSFDTVTALFWWFLTTAVQISLCKPIQNDPEYVCQRYLSTTFRVPRAWGTPYCSSVSTYAGCWPELYKLIFSVEARYLDHQTCERNRFIITLVSSTHLFALTKRLWMQQFAISIEQTLAPISSICMYCASSAYQQWNR